MSFPTRWRREEDLWFVCLFRGAAKGPLLWWFFGAPLWMPPRPPPPAYSCRGAPCAWNLNEEPGAAGGALRGGEVTAALGPCAAGTALCMATTSQASPAQLSSSVPAMALMRGATVPLGWLGGDKSVPHFLPPQAVRWLWGAWPWLTWLPTGSEVLPPPPWFQLF